MDREREIALLEELHGLKDNGLFFLDEEVRKSPVERYASPERFARENDAIFRAVPRIAAHASELPEPGSFLTLQLSGLPVLLTRDKGGEVLDGPPLDVADYAACAQAIERAITARLDEWA